MKFKKFEDFQDLKMECPVCGEDMELLLKELTLDGESVAVSYYLTAVQDHLGTHEPELTDVP